MPHRASQRRSKRRCHEAWCKIIHSILDTRSSLCASGGHIERRHKHRKRFPRAALKKRSARAAPRAALRLSAHTPSLRRHTLHLSQWHSWTSSLISLHVQYKCDSPTELAALMGTFKSNLSHESRNFSHKNNFEPKMLWWRA